MQAQYSDSQIDSLLVKAETLRKTGEFDRVGRLYALVLTSARLNNYSNGLARGYVRIANLYTLQGNYITANHYLDSAQLLIPSIENQRLEITIHLERGKNYYFLNLLERSFRELKKALSMTAGIKNDSTRRERAAHTHEYLSLAYEKADKTDSAFAQVKMAFSTNPTPVMASRISRFYLRQYNNVDSARKYLSVAKSMIATGHYNVHSQSMVLRMEGIFDFEQGRFAQAVANYQKSIEISRKLGIKSDEMITNRLLSAAYKAMNDEDGMALTLERYTGLSDSLSAEGRVAVEAVVKAWLNETEKSGNAALYRSYGMLGFLLLIAVAVLYLIIRRSRRRLSRSGRELAQKEQLIKESVRKQEELSQKINETFTQLVALAKDNHPHFYVRFREVYPELHQKLLNLTPDLQSTELTLCAYIYLDFSTQEIARYSFKSPKTIQNRKNSLRKRLKIDSADDLYVWIKRI